jgi:hypothetical protein
MITNITDVVMHLNDFLGPISRLAPAFLKTRFSPEIRMQNKFKKLDNPKSLSEPIHHDIKRKNLENIPVHSFLLENVLSKEECEHYIMETEKAGTSGDHKLTLLFLLVSILLL